MSYDLMVFEPSATPREGQVFAEWYEDQTKWAEPHGYDDPEVTSSRLAAWFADMIKSYPPMNGPLRSRNSGSSRVTDYSIGRTVI